MANRELQEWQVETGENRLFQLSTPVGQVPARVEDMQKAVRNFGRDSLSFTPVITWDATNTTLLVTFGATNIRRYDFLDDNQDPPDGFFFSAVIPSDADASTWSGTAAITMALRQKTGDSTFTPLRTDKKYELKWSGSGASVNGAQLFAGDELMFIFDETDTTLKVRKFLNRVVRNDLQPKVKVFPGSQFQALTSATLNVRDFIYHDIAPSDVSSNTITSWMWFFVAGAGSRVNIKFTFTGQGSGTDSFDLSVNELLTALNANPEMLVTIESGPNYSPAGSFFLDLDSSGAKARKHDSTQTSSLHALYGRPFIVSSLNSSNEWTNHGYVRGGRPYAHLQAHLWVVTGQIVRVNSRQTVSIDPDAPIDSIAPVVRPLGIPTPFDSTTNQQAQVISGLPPLVGNTFPDMPTATQRRGYEVGIESLEGLVSSGDPGDTLFVTPPVETIRLWMPEFARTNPYFRKGNVDSPGTVTYANNRDTDYFLTGGRGGCSEFFDFTTGKVGYPLPSGFRNFHSNAVFRYEFIIDEPPECGPDGYAVCVYWEE